RPEWTGRHRRQRRCGTAIPPRSQVPADRGNDGGHRAVVGEAGDDRCRLPDAQLYVPSPLPTILRGWGRVAWNRRRPTENGWCENSPTWWRPGWGCRSWCRYLAGSPETVFKNYEFNGSGRRGETTWRQWCQEPTGRVRVALAGFGRKWVANRLMTAL